MASNFLLKTLRTAKVGDVYICIETNKEYFVICNEHPLMANGINANGSVYQAEDNWWLTRKATPEERQEFHHVLRKYGYKLTSNFIIEKQ